MPEDVSSMVDQTSPVEMPVEKSSTVEPGPVTVPVTSNGKSFLFFVSYTL